jgi:hypothetical protein
VEWKSHKRGTKDPQVKRVFSVARPLLRNVRARRLNFLSFKIAFPYQRMAWLEVLRLSPVSLMWDF